MNTIIITQIKEYCKKFNYKLEKIINENEFIASQKVNIFAGMEYIHGTNKIKSIPIRKIGTKIKYEKHICFDDGDIVGNGYINNLNTY